MWGLQQIKVTLKDDETGEELVIDQGPEGKASGKPRSKPAKVKEKPPGNAKTDKPPADGKTDKPPKAPATAPKVAKSGNGRKPSRQASKSLVWSPVRDNGYEGFTATSGGGRFKLLKAQNTQWALFFELRGTDARKVGCFGNDNKAKVRAQELHDKGWPANEKSGEVTEADLAQACPLPSDSKKKEPKVKKPETKNDAPEAEPTGPAPVPATEAEQDKELLGSFAKELDSVLDEDDD